MIRGSQVATYTVSFWSNGHLNSIIYVIMIYFLHKRLSEKRTIRYMNK